MTSARLLLRKAKTPEDTAETTTGDPMAAHIPGERYEQYMVKDPPFRVMNHVEGLRRMKTARAHAAGHVAADQCKDLNCFKLKIAQVSRLLVFRKAFAVIAKCAALPRTSGPTDD